MKEISVKKKKKLYEGSAKIVYETDSEDYYIQEFKDDALDGQKKGKIKSKGMINNQISGQLFTYLESYHVPTHFVKQLADNSMVVKKLEMVPVEVVMRNMATGSLVKRYGVDEGKELEHPIIEFYLKDDSKKDPMINEDHIVSFEHASEEEIKQIKRFTQKVNAVLKSYFVRRNMLLVDFKLEFGRSKSGKIKIGDEISADTCHFWNVEPDDKIDKDRFRIDGSKIEEAYKEVYDRVFK